MSNLLSYLMKNQKVILNDLKVLVQHESPTSQKDLVDQCGDFLKQLIGERLGLDVKEYSNEKYGKHLRFEFGQGKEQILMLAHYDTVWEKGKLKFRIEGSRAYGPGILDMKGGIIQGIWALKSIKELQNNFNKKIVFLLTSDEEQSSSTSRDLIEKEAKNSKVVLVLEPAVAKTGALKTSRKGAGLFKIHVKGIASHAGNDPDIHASAIHELANQIKYLESLANPTAGTTINVGVVKGGSVSNVVAESAEAEIDVRFFTEKEAKRIELEFKHLKPIYSKTTVNVTGEIKRPPMEKSEESNELFELAQRCGEELGFQISGTAVGGASDGNFTSAIGIPTLDGLGAVGEGIHAIHEHVIIDEITNRTALLVNLLLKLSEN